MGKVFTLTNGRHNIRDVNTGLEITRSIFGNKLDLNIQILEDFAKEFIHNNGIGKYEIYVTGFTPALTSFIKVAMQEQIVRHLTLYHYDKVADNYRKQTMW